MCYRWTLVPVLPSMPWARPQAAGRRGTDGSDCQDGHRGREAPAVQGAEREKVTGGLLYRFCPRCRGHAHRPGCAGSRGSNRQDGHRGAGGHCGARGGKGKITGGLSYPFCPRCRPWPSPAGVIRGTRGRTRRTTPQPGPWAAWSPGELVLCHILPWPAPGSGRPDPSGRAC